LPECHKCTVDADIKAGRYKRAVWANVPCSACPNVIDTNSTIARIEGLPSHGGRVHVRFQENVHDVPTAAAGTDPSMTEAGEMAAYVLKSVLELDPGTREVVMERIAHPDHSFRVIADRLGIGVSTAHDRLRKAREEWPALASAIPMSSWAWSKRKKKNARARARRRAKRRAADAA
tara:strand:+ start:221 stop:748 length:528 start_codon:yes stop_codon:yes gene_type:complete